MGIWNLEMPLVWGTIGNRYDMGILIYIWTMIVIEGWHNWLQAIAIEDYEPSIAPTFHMA